MTDRPAPLSRDALKVHRRLATRWMDVDVYGHVNNVVYLSFFDTAVNGWLIENGVLDPRGREPVFLVVETQCSYFSELVFPDEIIAGLRVARLGKSSVTYDIALFSSGSDVASAQGRFVHVLVDAASRRPVPIEGPRRDLLESILA